MKATIHQIQAWDNPHKKFAIWILFFRNITQKKNFSHFKLFNKITLEKKREVWLFVLSVSCFSHSPQPSRIKVIENKLAQILFRCLPINECTCFRVSSSKDSFNQLIKYKNNDTVHSSPNEWPNKWEFPVIKPNQNHNTYILYYIHN